ncbi:GntR family transcriptional regulator [Burkholderia gladioli]|uniref:GntR family transcriptional regulator n=1 Tax=Burkholderia gladioli TaxID=28095 RepID=UPI000BBD0343|nr:GntR family transcriptional regulator [Burkholderia gladioli]ATF88848.1 GntR family transcriptional regulator [Burkholderia gladioli pv. gladioli]MBJ9715880.1 GntR family transcriptional regulator [Burkholderia gladioli]MBU9158765.1 GntR family transcriptional regulator [Burkholderia gladioli]MCH7275152.1 GntR family transcriptional regulator [Burkholderia gladioli]MDN7917733.1 GntR family transcriptional regulator [Burkholderia gladioli]
MSDKVGLLRPETLRQQVENALRQAIVSGQFAPGARLVERELCDLLGVSRTSIREALRKLEGEKLIKIFPHKGPVVAVMSRQEAAEIYAIRALLEGYAAAGFARLASDDQLNRFGERMRVLKAAAKADDSSAILKAKTDLYDTLLEHCGNALAKEMLLSLYSRITLLRATSLMQIERLPASLRELDKLHKALKERNAEAAEVAARRHVEAAQEAAMQMLPANSE